MQVYHPAWGLAVSKEFSYDFDEEQYGNLHLPADIRKSN